MSAAKRLCPKCGGTGRIDDDREIGAEMRRLRERAGLAAYEVARRLGCSPAYVSDLELGKRTWNAERMARFKAACQ